MFVMNGKKALLICELSSCWYVFPSDWRNTVTIAHCSFLLRNMEWSRVFFKFTCKDKTSVFVNKHNAKKFKRIGNYERDIPSI